MTQPPPRPMGPSPERILSRRLVRRVERPGVRVAIACSGGRDSSLLLHLAAQWAREAQHPLVALHVHHGLRGEASEDDAAFVAATAERLGVPCQILRVRVDQGPGLEARARAARYDAFQSATAEGGPWMVVLAHHRDDQEETICLRAQRGAGPRGLSGMPRSRPLTRNAQLVRPWLGVPGHVIAGAAEALGVPWRTDSSNADLVHRRNLLRHAVLPSLEMTRPDLRREVRRLGLLARLTQWELESAAKPLIERATILATTQFKVLLAAQLMGLPIPLSFTVLRLVLPSLDRDSHRRVLEVLDGNRGSGSVGGGWRAVREGNSLWLLAPDPLPLAPISLPIPGCVTVPHLGLQVHATLENAPSALGRAAATPWLAALNPKAIVGTLRVRPVQPKDRYRPLGQGGRVSLRKGLSALRIPIPARVGFPVVTDDQGPLWLPGRPPAARVGVDPTDVDAVQLSVVGAEFLGAQATRLGPESPIQPTASAERHDVPVSGHGDEEVVFPGWDDEIERWQRR